MFMDSIRFHSDNRLPKRQQSETSSDCQTLGLIWNHTYDRL
jgi:hypothetical protein